MTTGSESTAPASTTSPTPPTDSATPQNERYDPKEAEARLAKSWEEEGVYRWNPSVPRANTFAIDTPPPTVSGSLHLGHAFSYTHTDLIARFQRMCGKNVFYPMGWDDNGLATERRVQNYYNIRCNPTIPYQEGWTPTVGDNDPKNTVHVSRQNFIEACSLLTTEDEAIFERLWRRLGLSIDWSQQYATINEHCRRTSQSSFIDLYEKGTIYNQFAPTMWDVDFTSAVAQAEIEDRERQGNFYDITFLVQGGEQLTIATTRPELLAACVAVVAHPDDARYQHLFGKTAITPLFGARVPILPAQHADPEKGTGILMVCTFGDLMDVEFWRSSGLPLKQVVGLNGKLLPVDFNLAPFDSTQPERAAAAYAELVNRSTSQARTKIGELLNQPGSLDGVSSRTALEGTPRPINHTVKFYEKGDRPLEIVPTRQWFVRILDKKDGLLEQGRKIAWHPAFMRTRYEHWVLGLNQDWCISRQRYFGVPFPVWYPINEHGITQYDKPILPSRESLPIDPANDTPAGYLASQRDVANGFTGDLDVMDTWATSSLTPQIMSYWVDKPERHESLFPMDMRPQGHDIIRTWAFYTILKAWLHEGQIPWKNATISGWILDPDRKKMSKSKGNVITPDHLLEQYSSDAVRYWAARGRLGADTAIDEKVFKIGQKLITKIENAAKFVLLQCGDALDDHKIADITYPLDLAIMTRLRNTITEATTSFEHFDYASALQRIEEEFWFFCDHGIELLKGRAYQDDDLVGKRSSQATLAHSLSIFMRLFAPFLPFITEEVWSTSFRKFHGDVSIHKAKWPTPAEAGAGVPDSSDRCLAALESAVTVVGAIRGAKTAAKRSLRWPVDSITISATEAMRTAIELGLDDIRRTGMVVGAVNWAEQAVSGSGDGGSSNECNVEVTLSETNE